MHFNTKYIFKGDTEREIIGKINYNFDQILSFAIGPDGHPGPIGPTGIFGPAGRRGATGMPGIRASNWYKQTTEPSLGLSNINDIWIDNSISDGDVKVFNGSSWANSGYTFLNSKYFKSYPYIQGPGGASDKYAIGFKNPGGITAAADMSLVINDSTLTPTTSNPNNSKVLISTDDQIDTPIMTFSKNGAVSDDVPSFYWNSVGNNTGLKFDSGGSFYITTNDDFIIDTGLARTLITSDYCNFRSNQSRIEILGDGDFSFSSNMSVGVGGFINVSTSNLIIDNASFNHSGGVTITSPLTSTYILNSSPSSTSYQNGISVSVTDAVNKALDFNDYTGNPVLSTKPFGSLASNSFGQTIFGSTGGFTGGTGGPFSYHVKKVTELRNPTSSLTARKYLTESTNTNLIDVFDASANNNWETDHIMVTPTAYGASSSNYISSYKVGNVDVNFNIVPALDIFGTGFKNSLSGTYDPYNALVNDVCKLSGDGSRIFVGNFKYYNDQIVKTFGSLTNVLGICKVNSDGTMDTGFSDNISSINVINAGTINGIILDDTNARAYIYGSFTYKVGTVYKYGIMCLDLTSGSQGNLEPYFTSNMNAGINTGTEIYKAIWDGTYIYAVGNFTRYYDLVSNYYRNGIVKIYASNTTSTRGKVVPAFMTNTANANGPGFVGTNVPYCLTFTDSSLVIGGSFSNFRNSNTTANTQVFNVVELNTTTGAKISTSNQFTSMTSQSGSSFVVDPIVSSIKYNQNDSKIYIGGSFIAINGISYKKIARFTINGSHDIILDTSFSVGTGFNDIVNDFAFDTYGYFPNRIYVGGRFSTYNGTTTPGFVALNLSGSIDPAASIYHNVVSPGTIYGIYQYSLGLVKKIYLDMDPFINEFTYVGGFLNSIFSSATSGGGVYIKIPSSLSSDYAPIYTDGTSTTYRVFLNDFTNDPTVHFIKGIVFDTGLPNALTSYVDFGTSGCQYADLMWVSKSSIGNISPRLFYKNCQGISGYVDFDSRGVYSLAPTAPNTSQSVSVAWELNRQQTGSCTIFKNGTGVSNITQFKTTSGSGSLAYSIGDKIYATVSAGGNSSGYIGVYSSLIIRKTSIVTGVTTTEFSTSSYLTAGSVNNYSNPVTIQSGYNYYVQCDAHSESSGGGCCFVGDTKISMSDGTNKNIEDVNSGDSILTFNVETGLYETGIVTSIESPIKDDIIEFIFSDETRIKATTEHPFWVIGKGWSSYYPDRTMMDHEMEVCKLEIGDILLDDNGNQIVLISMLNNNSEFQRVYNILMGEGNHTYYANGILVHNKLVYLV